MRASHNSLHASGSGEHTNPCCRGCPGGCGKHQHHCRAWSCQPHLEESDMTHMALAGLCWAARLCASGELAGIHGRILESHWSRKGGGGNKWEAKFGHWASCSHSVVPRWWTQFHSVAHGLCTLLHKHPKLTLLRGGSHSKQVFTHPKVSQAVRVFFLLFQACGQRQQHKGWSGSATPCHSPCLPLAHLSRH